MIVLDEQISNYELCGALARWYPGKVIWLRDLRPYSQILDPEINKLLLKLKRPTFITTNYADFWHKVPAHKGYCILCLRLPIERWREVAPITRQILNRPDFATKKNRMGKVISWSDGAVTFYGI